ncbi:Uncharacterised protein [Streptococcus pneumoniae]|nr:Uncharacterised protein [Streptococcus pneumoniae]CJO19806.1 Uncharacterised protein [Streptococcus pneumoniae]
MSSEQQERMAVQYAFWGAVHLVLLFSFTTYAVWLHEQALKVN